MPATRKDNIIKMRTRKVTPVPGDDSIISWPTHTGLEALPSKKKVSIDGTGVPGFLRPVW